MDNETVENGNTITRDMGEQPVAKIMEELSLDAHDLVVASETPISHKLISRAAKGRRLTAHSMELVRKALSKASGRTFAREELFNYR